MALRNKLDSNDVGLRYAIESSTYKSLPASPIWVPLDPNSYSDFGGNVSTVARSPIEQGRQRRKGVAVDLDASGGFNIDLTATNIEELLEGFMFATRRYKGIIADFGAGSTPQVETAGDSFQNAGTDFSDLAGLVTGTLIYASGFGNATNNGLHICDTAITNTNIAVSTNLVDENPAPSGSRLDVVGFQSTAGDFTIDVSGTWPKLVSGGSIDFTDLGNGVALIPGEWIFIGGDASGLKFPDAVNNGWKRIRTVSATELEFDKSDSDMVVDSDTTGLTIQIFWGNVLKNEDGTEASFPITRTSYHLERDLGEPETGSSNNQYEYLVGAVASQMTLNLATADKMTADMTFIAADAVQFAYGDAASAYRTSGTPTFPDLVDTDAFNTTNDVKRFRMALVDTTDEAPTPLFAYLTDATLDINNNLSPAKAISVFGAFDITVGTFAVSGSVTAYFSDIAAVAAVRNNSDVTLDIAMVKENKGIVIDMPLLSLGDGRVNVEKDAPITIPVSFDAAKGSKVLSTYTHTLLWNFFPYLPELADS